MLGAYTGVHQFARVGESVMAAGGLLSALILIPGMLAGRLTILPLLLAVASVLRARDWTIRETRRLLRVGR